MREIDCRGMSCPQPVVTTKQALDQLEEGELIIIVDNPSSCGNVERFARSQECPVDVEKREEDFYISEEIIIKTQLGEKVALNKLKNAMPVTIEYMKQGDTIRLLSIKVIVNF